MKSRYKALGVPKTPVFILQTTKIRPMKPRKDVARETMSRNARLRTRDCNVSTSTLQALRIRQRPVSHKRTRFETISSPSANRHRGSPRRLAAQSLERRNQFLGDWMRAETRVSAARSRRDTERHDAALARPSPGSGDGTTR